MEVDATTTGVGTELFLELLEGCVGFRGPGQRLGLFSEQGGEWGNEKTEVIDKWSIKIVESKD